DAREVVLEVRAEVEAVLDADDEREQRRGRALPGGGQRRGAVLGGATGVTAEDHRVDGGGPRRGEVGRRAHVGRLPRRGLGGHVDERDDVRRLARVEELRGGREGDA